jgi:hypothetical protein
MKAPINKGQSGYALIMLVVGLMAFGGILIAGFTQEVKKEVDHKRFLHNDRILKEAKQALLQYAYNHPVTSPTNRGPGRLPCPDIDNDGDAEVSFFCINATVPMVGRFPWDQEELNFYDARDASGERLWYAVSNNFAQTGPPVINSSTQGSISIYDQAGNLQYDGTLNGVAAVIIAPGAAIARNGVMQNRVTANENIPIHYLDLFGALDNADFVNADANGFVLGPVDSLTSSSIIVNDQIIVITADEVIAMAEKATLQAYRNAINEYLIDTGGVYPWLYNYNVATKPDLIDTYPALADFTTATTGERDVFLDNIGRVPSMFDPYFTAEVNSRSIESQLSLNLFFTYTGPLAYVEDFPGSSAGTYNLNIAPGLNFPIQTVEPLTALRFEDAGTPNNIRLTGTLAVAESVGASVYFSMPFANDPDSDPWTICPGDGDVIEDCHVDGLFNPDPGGVGAHDVRVLKVDAILVFPAGANAVQLTFNVSGLTGLPTNPAVVAATNSAHATITASFPSSDLGTATPILFFRFEYDDMYINGGLPSFDIVKSGNFNIAGFTLTALDIGLRYYPVLPDWVASNGWHDSVMMAYADDYIPGATAPCTVGTDCLQITNFPGADNNKVSLLVIAGEHDWVDEGTDGFFNDIIDVFGSVNAVIDDTFQVSDLNNNDKILVIDELP